MIAKLEALGKGSTLVVAVLLLIVGAVGGVVALWGEGVGITQVQQMADLVQTYGLDRVILSLVVIGFGLVMGVYVLSIRSASKDRNSERAGMLKHQTDMSDKLLDRILNGNGGPDSFGLKQVQGHILDIHSALLRGEDRMTHIEGLLESRPCMADPSKCPVIGAKAKEA